jgi:hypothetical protein
VKLRILPGFGSCYSFLLATQGSSVSVSKNSYTYPSHLFLSAEGFIIFAAIPVALIMQPFLGIKKAVGGIVIRCSCLAVGISLYCSL